MIKMGYTYIVCFLYVLGTRASIVPQRREAFDPNRLMQNYMGMRTDQSSFGSYHPNDLVHTIQSYFKGGEGTQTLPNRQWGLSIYNPNDAMHQYVGDLSSAGALGSKEEKPKTNDLQDKQNQIEVQMTGFNPDKVNKMLLNSIDGYSANAINKELMQDITNSRQNGGTTSTPTLQEGGVGFDPDRLNANLFGDLEYDPNSAMASINSFQGTHRQGNAAAAASSSAAPSLGNSSNTFDRLGGGVDSMTGGNSQSGSIQGSSNQVSNIADNQHAGVQVDNNMATGAGQNITNPLRSQSSTMSAMNGHAQTGSANFNAGGLGSPSQVVGGQHIGYTGQSGANASGNNAGTVPKTDGIGNNHSAGFNAGGIGTNGSSDPGQGTPLGVSSGSGTVKQTEVAMPVPSGIGGMGGKLS